jgi:hypothetical protein
MSCPRKWLRWSCSNFVHHEHRWKTTAWLCSRIQLMLFRLRGVPYEMRKPDEPMSVQEKIVMTEKEKTIIEAKNRDMINAAWEFMQLFSKALQKAARAGDGAMLERLAQTAEHYRDHLAKYIDLCGDQGIDNNVLQVHNYFAEKVTDIRAALNRKPEDADSGEDWKKG